MLFPRTCTLWRLVHASLLNRKHPVGFIRSGKYFTWQIIWSTSSGYTFLPLLNRGDPGTPQGKILVRTPHRVCALSSVPWLHYHSCIITDCKKSLTLSYLLLVAHRIKIICHGIIQRKSKSGASVSFSRR